MRLTMLAPFGIRPKGTLIARMLPLAQALTRRGHQVHIIAPPVHNPQDAGCSFVYDGVNVTHTARLISPGMTGVPPQVAALLHRVLNDTPDILHLFKPKGYSGLAALLAGMLRPAVPLVVDTDDWEGWGGWNSVLPHPYTAKMLFAWQERDLPRRAAAVTVASRTLQTQVWGSGVPPERVFYLPNGVILPPEHPPIEVGDSKTILLYTRFWEFDVRDLVAALVALVQECPDVCLLVVGKGEHGQEQDLLAFAHHAGVARSIDYRGWVQPEEVSALFARATLAIVPLDDTLINRARCSAKLLDMLAAGLPVVAADVGQVREYMQDGASGLLVPPGDPAALAQAVLRLLADVPLQRRLAAGARQALPRFSWDVLALTAERAYATAASQD